jgi:transposase
MRYPDGGGVTAEGRSRRERVRLQAAGMFEQGMSAVQVAGLLRVSAKPAYQWRAWRSGGEAGLASKGPGGSACRRPCWLLSRARPRDSTPRWLANCEEELPDLISAFGAAGVARVGAGR